MIEEMTLRDLNLRLARGLTTVDPSVVLWIAGKDVRLVLKPVDSYVSIPKIAQVAFPGGSGLWVESKQPDQPEVLVPWETIAEIRTLHPHPRGGMEMPVGDWVPDGIERGILPPQREAAEVIDTNRWSSRPDNVFPVWGYEKDQTPEELDD